MELVNLISNTFVNTPDYRYSYFLAYYYAPNIGFSAHPTELTEKASVNTLTVSTEACVEVA
jgi:hypothetical protein